MAAASAVPVSTSEPPIVEDVIWKVITGKHRESKNSGKITPESYLLRFTIDEAPFETIFQIINDDFGAGVLTNKCITLADFRELESGISSNSPAKGCFTPTLSRANLPADITPTDILQSLSTKLKFAILKKKSSFVISDVARLPNPAKGTPFTTQLSRWRIVRGERTLYEKYGYTAPDLEPYRELVRSTLWSEIMVAPTPVGKTLQEIADEYYPGIFTPEKTIATAMQSVSLEDTERYIQPGIAIRMVGARTIVGLIMDALKAVKGIPPPTFVVAISRSSDIWKAWDARLKFVSFEPIGATATAGQGGGRRRRTRRRRIQRSCSKRR